MRFARFVLLLPLTLAVLGCGGSARPYRAMAKAIIPVLEKLEAALPH